MKSKKNFDVINVMIAIVKKYECSSDCDGMCCKMQPIDFSYDEYSRMLSQVDPQSKEILLTQTEDDEKVRKEKVINIPIELAESFKHKKLRQFKTNICPMLENKKCRIYQYRPEVCKPYPFKIDHLFVNGYVEIEPCLMGLDLIFDYLAMTFDYSLYYHDEQSKFNYTRETLELILTMYNDRIYPEHRTGDAIFAIKDLTMLIKFKHYLKNYSLKRRLYERNLMYEFVKSHSREQINSITISEFISKFQSS